MTEPTAPPQPTVAAEEKVTTTTESTVTVTGSSAEAHPAARRANDQALANSVPDDNSILKYMLDALLAVTGWVKFIAVTGAMIIMFTYTLAKWGTMFILAMQPMIMPWWQGQKEVAMADRTVQAAQATATKDVVNALSGVTDALKGLSSEVTSVRADVNQLKSDRLADSKRLSAFAAEQKRQREQAPSARR